MTDPVARTDGSSFERVVAALGERVTRLDGARRHADGQCPAHDDQRPSLTVDWRQHPDKGGLTLLRCHSAGCEFGAILAAVGLGKADSYDTEPYSPQSGATLSRGGPPARQSASPVRPVPSQAGPGPIEQEYPYCGADGTVVGTFRRHEGKGFSWARPGMPKPCPLFLLPQVVAAVAAEEWVHLAEGEKDALALAEAGVCATTVPNGVAVTRVGAVKRDGLTEEHRQSLTGAHVTVWADRDGPDGKAPERGYLGYRHALHVREALAPVAASVRVVQAAAGKDAADHLAAGHTVGEAVEIEPTECVPAEVLERWQVTVHQAGQQQNAVQQAAGGETAESAAGEAGGQVVAFPAGGSSQRRHGGGGDSRSGKKGAFVAERFELYSDEHDTGGQEVIVRVKETTTEITRYRVLDASARLLRVITRDAGDATDSRALVDLEISKGGKTATLRSLPWKEFEDPTKWAPQTGLNLIFNRGQGKGQLANAILAVSGPIETETAYGVLGWREISEGRWAYLHAGGAIDADGPVPGTRVECSPNLSNFRLPAPPQGQQLRESLHAMLTLADELPHHIAYPLISAGARAVLGDCQTSLFALGRRGTFKSGTIALAQQMWDSAASYKNLPAGAGEDAATTAGLEHVLYECGHSLLVIDDLAPDRGSARASARGAELMRKLGNSTGKIRSTRESDSTRATKTPRALAILSGEDQPTVASAERRTVYLPFTPGEITLDALQRLSAPELRRARPGVTAALAQRAAATMPDTEWRDAQTARWAAHLLADHAVDDGALAGYANNIGELATGLHELLAMGREAGVLSEGEVATRWAEGWAALRDVLARQLEMTERRALSDRAADLLRSAIRAGKAHLAHPEGGCPADRQDDALRYGWSAIPTAPLSGPAFASSGACVGWVPEDGLVQLDPGAAFNEIEQQGRGESDPLAVTRRALQADLIASGVLTTEPSETGGAPRLVRRQVAGSRQRVWEMRVEWLYPDDDTGTGRPPSGGDSPPPPPGSDDDSTPPPVGAAPTTTAPAEPAPAADPAPAAAAETPAAGPTPPAAPAAAPGGQPTARRGRQPAPDPLGGDGRGYTAAGIVCDVDGAYLVGGSGQQPDMPSVSTVADLVSWATGLHLGIRRPGGRSAREKGARDDAGLIVIMPRLARRLGAPKKAPERGKPGATNNKVVRGLSADGWTVGERGLQPYTQVYPTKGGPAAFVVFSDWIVGEPLFEGDAPAPLLAHRLALYVAHTGMQLLYTSRSTGAELLKQLRAYTPHPLSEKVHETPPPGCVKEHAPIEDGEWHWWRGPTEQERAEFDHVVAIDINADYLPAAASAVVGNGEPTEHAETAIPDTLRRCPGYWLIDPPEQHDESDPRLPQLWHPSADDSRTGPRWVATPYLIALREAGYDITMARQAWLYPNPGTHLQVWAHKLRDAIYDLRTAEQADPADEDVTAVLASIKLTYAGAVGMWGSARWKTGTELWLPHYRHSVIGLAMANRWRKIAATAAATGRYPLGIYRDAIYYPSTSPTGDDLPQVTGGFRLQQPGEPYQVGKTKLAATATMDDYAAAEAVPDPKHRRQQLEAVWTMPHQPGNERSE